MERRNLPAWVAFDTQVDTKNFPCGSVHSKRSAQCADDPRAINDLVGDFHKELSSAGHAIIHDKIVVIDPMSKTDCTVITGSHNLGFKASYANDENMVIIRGQSELALAYTVHVLDLYDHFKFRAVLEQQNRDAMLSGQSAPKRPSDKGFLETTDKWQDPYLAGQKGRELDYWPGGAGAEWFRCSRTG